MTESTALTTTTQSQAVAVSRQAPAAGATVKSIEAMLRPPGARDLITSGPLNSYSRSMVDTVKNSVAKGAPDEELFRLFVMAGRYNLDPFAKELWCINMGTKDQPQWQVTPSRDGLRRAARRNPHVADIRSGLIREGDEFTYDGDEGTYKHRAKVSAKKGPIIASYCQIVLASGKKHIEVFYPDEVRRDTPVWRNFFDRMMVTAAERTMIKRHVGMSDLYTDDQALEVVDEMETAIHVMPDPGAEYVDGFVVGVEPPQLTAGTHSDAGPDRTSRADGVKALNESIRIICGEVNGADGGDAMDARTAWLKANNKPLLSKITDAAVVWELADLLNTPNGAAAFAEHVVAARDARWTKEANAKEAAEAGQPVQAAQPVAEASDDDIPTFDDAPLLNGGAA